MNFEHEGRKYRIRFKHLNNSGIEGDPSRMFPPGPERDREIRRLRKSKIPRAATILRIEAKVGDTWQNVSPKSFQARCAWEDNFVRAKGRELCMEQVREYAIAKGPHSPTHDLLNKVLQTYYRRR